MLLQTGQSINLLDKLKGFDYKLFSKINGEWHNSFFDTFFPFTREALFWAPFYFFLDVFATSPPIWTSYKLYKKDINELHLAEVKNLEEARKKIADQEAKKKAKMTASI